MKYKTSVVLCTYNGEKYIEEQLKSIFQQSIKPEEIIVVDDRSSDLTVKIAKKNLEESHIPYQVIINNDTLGVVLNFQKGIELSNSEIIFLCDQDDLWEKQKIELILSKFSENPKAMMVFSNAYLVNEDREKFSYLLWDLYKFKAGLFNEQKYYDILLKKCVVTGATMAIRRELFDQAKPFPINGWIHDSWLAIVAPLYGDIIAIDQPLIEYRQHSTNVLGAKKLSINMQYHRFKKNIKNISTFRDNDYDKFAYFYLKNSARIIETGNEARILECIGFWDEMKKLNNAGFFNGNRILFNCYKNGTYTRYLGGLKKMVLDELSLIFKHRRLYKL